MFLSSQVVKSHLGSSIHGSWVLSTPTTLGVQCFRLPRRKEKQKRKVKSKTIKWTISKIICRFVLICILCSLKTAALVILLWLELHFLYTFFALSTFFLELGRLDCREIHIEIPDRLLSLGDAALWPGRDPWWKAFAEWLQDAQTFTYAEVMHICVCCASWIHALEHKVEKDCLIP